MEGRWVGCGGVVGWLMRSRPEGRWVVGGGKEEELVEPAVGLRVDRGWVVIRDGVDASMSSTAADIGLGEMG